MVYSDKEEHQESIKALGRRFLFYKIKDKTYKDKSIHKYELWINPTKDLIWEYDERGFARLYGEKNRLLIKVKLKESKAF